ncbi:MAG: alpha-isopropylmalate synthase regulatory domain-containing protein, partial [Bacteroidota bacterium]
EIMRAEDVGQAGEQIRLGRHSGRHGFFSRLAKLGLDVAEEDRQPLYQAFLALADHKKEIVDEDLVHLVQGQGPAPSKPAYELVEVDVRVGTGDVPHANVGVRDNDNDTVYRTSATGDGPIDAICRAINAAVGEPHQLVSYSLQSLTGGTDALGDATVVIVAAGQPFRGTGRHTDVIQASANAYMEALNRMHAHRTGSDNIDFAMQGVRGSFG